MGSISIEQNHKSIDVVKKGQSGAGVAVRIEGATQQLFGRHIDEKDLLYSHITRHSIDTLKLPAIKDEVTKEEWALIVKLKGVYPVLYHFWLISRSLAFELHGGHCVYSICTIALHRYDSFNSCQDTLTVNLALRLR